VKTRIKKLVVVSALTVVFLVLAVQLYLGWIIYWTDDRVEAFSWEEAGLRVAEVPRRGGLTETFVVTADLHLGHPGMDAANQRQLRAMHALPGTAWPGIAGGRVEAPRGILVAGDVTERGAWQEWQRFEALYAGQSLPVFVGLGNHDRLGYAARLEAAVRERHGGTCYAWDWGDLHLDCLGEAPDAECLSWLAADLARTGRERPVVLFLHLALKGPFMFRGDNWFGGSREKARLAGMLQGFNVVAIFHGHFHGSGRYRWHDMDVYNVGSPKHGWRSFAVVRVTDTALTVASFHWEAGAWWWAHHKPLNDAPGPEQPWVWDRGGDPPPLIPHPLEESW
jgi:hypothetical protein